MKRLHRLFLLVLAAGLLFVHSAVAGDSNSNYRAAVESIDTAQISGIITYLADDAMEGRESGTRGNRKSGEFIADYFEELGLEPAGEGGSYFQNFSPNYRNILAVLPGSDPELAREIILVGAHYDHVGYGNRQNSAGPIGRIHNGADDNASGVSSVMELAEAMEMMHPRPKRTIAFVAWDAEEKGMLGSQHWTAHPTLSLDDIVLCINIDMVGRLRNDRLLIHGVRSGSGLRRLLAKSNAETRLRLDFDWGIKPIADHYPIFKSGIPAITFNSGMHDQYHTPYDDTELLNMAGVRRISRLLMAVITNAANETESPRYRAIAGRESRNTKRQLEAYSRSGPPRLGVRWRAPTQSENDVDGGVIVEGVNSGSAAAECGLQRGDRIVRIAGHVVNNAEEFPGMVATARNPVDIRVVRNGAEAPVALTASLRGEPVRLGISWNEDDAEPGTLILTNVIPGTVAAKADLRKSDRILSLEGARFRTADEFITGLSRTRTAHVEIERNGRIETKTIRFDSTVGGEEI